MKWLQIIFLFCVSNRLVNGSSKWDPKHPKTFDKKLYEEVLDPEICAEQLAYITENILENILLRAEFLDAGIRIPRGLFDLNLVDLGNYHQCLGIHDTSAKDRSWTSIDGKYCSINIPLQQDGLLQSPLLELPGFSELPWLLANGTEVTEDVMMKLKGFEAIKASVESLSGSTSDLKTRSMKESSILFSISLTLATCIPKTCSTQQALDTLLFNVTSTGFKYTEISCRLPNDKPFVAADYVAFIIFGILGLLTVASTAYDIRHSVILKKDPKSANTLYRSFSIYTNCRRLVTYTSTPTTIECLDGIRVISMMWVILGHTYSNILWIPVVNPIFVLEWIESASSIIILAAPMSVDTFFFLTGLLIVYTTAGKLKRMALVKNIHLFYLNRLLRMFPILATGVLLMSSWFNHVADGPTWEAVTTEVNNCRTFWWITLLHVQNYVKVTNPCLVPTWYLAVDTQLYFLSPLILFWVLTSRRAAWMSLTTTMVILLISATIYNTMWGFPASIYNPKYINDIAINFEHYYINTLTRASPFVLGMIFGYLLHTARETEVKVERIMALLLWVLCVCVMGTIIYITYPIQQDDWDNKTLDVIINSFMRPMWALGIGWMIFACAKGYGGPLNWLLSLRIWKLPSRLSFAIYILHHPLIQIVNSTEIHPFHLAHTPLMYRFIANCTLAMFVAFLATLLIDAPFSTLIKMAFSGKAKRPTLKEEEKVISISNRDPTPASRKDVEGKTKF